MPPKASAARACGAALAVAFCCAAAASALATGEQRPEPAAPASGLTLSGDQPLHIQADSGIEWQQNAQVYIARGHAAASRGDNEVHADTLIAHYRQILPAAAGSAPAAKTGNEGNIGGNTEIYRVDAEGHVVLKRGAATVVGDRAVYDVDQAVAIVTGKELKLTTATDKVTARDSLEWYDKKQIAVARGDAVANRGDKTIRADILTAYMVKTEPGQGGAHAKPARAAHNVRAITTKAATSAVAQPGQSKIDRVDAQGHVIVSRGADVGRGDFGVYNAVSGIATLIGNVVIARGKDVIRGDRGVMDLNNNVSRILPGPHERVQGLFVREQRGGKPAPPMRKAP